jgi:hypothetical protein
METDTNVKIGNAVHFHQLLVKSFGFLLELAKFLDVKRYERAVVCSRAV